MRIDVTQNGMYVACDVKCYLPSAEKLANTQNQTISSASYIHGCHTDTPYGSPTPCHTAQEAIEQAKRIESKVAAAVEAHNTAVRQRIREAALTSYTGPLYGKDSAGKFFQLA